MQIVENKALQFVTRKAEQIAALIPKSKILERNGPLAKVLVHWGPEEWQLLRNLGLKNPPHPILGRYKWPGIYTPFDHQLTTAAFLASHPRCYCLSEPGTGKTNAAAWAADYLLTKKLVKRVLVVCPVSIMDTAWRADLFRTLMHRSVGIASGTKRQREAVIAADYEFVIINFDGVKVAHQALMAGGFDLVIIDEATSVKNAQTERWKALNSLCKPGVRVWAMTGTPAAQSPLDAYGLAKLVRPDSVPRSYGMWRDRVMIKITQFKWVPHTNAKAMVHEVLQPAIRYTKEECLDLPDLLYATRELELSPQQKKYYEQVKTHMVALAAGEEITAANAATLINKLAQIAQGAAYADNGEVIQFDIKNRLAELMEVITGTNHKVLVFVPYRHVLSMLIDELGAALGPEQIAFIHGGVPATQRADIIKQFQTEDRPKVLLLVPQATAHGITLTRADNIVWWGPITSTEVYLQANSRAHRAGQTNKVTVTHLQGSPVERRMYAALQGKVNAHMDLVELYKQEIDNV